MQPKKGTIGKSPLENLVSSSESSPISETDTLLQQGEENSKGSKERLTLNLPVDLIERLKNAVYWTPGLTLAKVAEDALSAAMDKIEKEHGRPFPPRKESFLKRGRPIK